MRSHRTHARAVTLKIAEHLLDDVLYSLLFRLGTSYFLGLTPPVQPQRAFRMMPAEEPPPFLFRPAHKCTHTDSSRPAREKKAEKKEKHGGGMIGLRDEAVRRRLACIPDLTPRPPRDGRGARFFSPSLPPYLSQSESMVPRKENRPGKKKKKVVREGREGPVPAQPQLCCNHAVYAR